MIKKELNPKCGQRLKECLKNSRISQKDFAKKSKYTPQYISSIISGKKRLSLEAAMIFSETLSKMSGYNISKEYLLCESDYLNQNEEYRAHVQNVLDKNNKIRTAVNTLVSEAGYKIVGKYIANWKSIKTEAYNVYGITIKSMAELEQLVNDMTENIQPPQNRGRLEDEVPLIKLLYNLDSILEIQTPSGEIHCIRISEYYSHINEIENYVSFSMNSMINGSFGVPDKIEGSEATIEFEG